MWKEWGTIDGVRTAWAAGDLPSRTLHNVMTAVVRPPRTGCVLRSGFPTVPDGQTSSGLSAAGSRARAPSTGAGSPVQSMAATCPGVRRPMRARWSS